MHTCNKKYVLIEKKTINDNSKIKLEKSRNKY
jgi:hypothetical protein